MNFKVMYLFAFIVRGQVAELPKKTPRTIKKLIKSPSPFQSPEFVLKPAQV